MDAPRVGGDDLGAAFEELAPLPKRLTATCLVVVEERTVFVAGGLDIGELSDLAFIRLFLDHFIVSLKFRVANDHGHDHTS